MPRRVIWKTTIMHVDKLADYLTTHNFQPNKFELCYYDKDMVLIAWVHKEMPNIG